jgi:glucose uptake protein GlcU
VLRFYIVGTTALALLIVGLVLTADESSPRIARAAILLGALGMFACAWLIKRHQQR